LEYDELMKRPGWSDEPEPGRNPFAGLEKLRESLPAGSPGAPSKTPGERRVTAERAVIRYERKGRSGKEVTIVEKLALSTRDLERWCAEMKRALGVGGHVEGASLVLQGDQRDRVAEWVRSRGVRKVSVSGGSA
jgi:translation initiation factor 1